LLLWWSADGTKWFPLNCKNVQAIPNENPDPFETFATYREAMDRVYQGSTETFEGEYDRSAKNLKLKFYGLKKRVISGLG
jgi:hypothetical protein